MIGYKFIVDNVKYLICRICIQTTTYFRRFYKINLQENILLNS